MYGGGFFMKMKFRVVTALLTGVFLLSSGILWKEQPKGAWLCTAFSILCGEAVEGEGQSGQEVEFRWWLADRIEGIKDAAQEPV